MAGGREEERAGRELRVGACLASDPDMGSCALLSTALRQHRKLPRTTAAHIHCTSIPVGVRQADRRLHRRVTAQRRIRLAEAVSVPTLNAWEATVLDPLSTGGSASAMGQLFPVNDQEVLLSTMTQHARSAVPDPFGRFMQTQLPRGTYCPKNRHLHSGAAIASNDVRQTIARPQKSAAAGGNRLPILRVERSSRFPSGRPSSFLAARELLLPARTSNI